MLLRVVTRLNLVAKLDVAKVALSSPAKIRSIVVFPAR